jgi:hypothetical protein
MVANYLLFSSSNPSRVNMFLECSVQVPGLREVGLVLLGSRGLRDRRPWVDLCTGHRGCRKCLRVGARSIPIVFPRTPGMLPARMVVLAHGTSQISQSRYLTNNRVFIRIREEVVSASRSACQTHCGVLLRQKHLRPGFGRSQECATLN